MVLGLGYQGSGCLILNLNLLANFQARNRKTSISKLVRQVWSPFRPSAGSAGGSQLHLASSSPPARCSYCPCFHDGVDLHIKSVMPKRVSGHLNKGLCVVEQWVSALRNGGQQPNLEVDVPLLTTGSTTRNQAVHGRIYKSP